MTKRDRDLRIVLIVAIAATAAALTVVQAGVRHGPSDFASWWGARALLAGHDPYASVGPGRLYPLPFLLLYPLPSVLIALPLAGLPWPVVADAIFMAAGSGLLAWALTRQTVRNPQLLVFASFAWFYAIDTVQWAPLLTAAALVPMLGFLLICKPSIGLALYLGYPSRRATIGCVVFGLISIAIAPWWVREWLAILPLATNAIAPIRLPGGILMLAAVVKWRRPEARLLAALACIPHVPTLYEAVLLFLVVREWWEGILLAALTPILWLITRDPSGFADHAVYNAWRGTWQVWLLYLPCVAMVLCRPNVAPVTATDSLAPLMPARAEGHG